jgi:hypothetical protein
MPEWVNNRCGGVRWRSYPNGLIEVEGQGFPAVTPSDGAFTHLQQTWDNWKGLFRSAAAKQNLPVSWLVGIASTETGNWSGKPVEQATIVSPAGAVGVMQIMPAFQPETAAQLSIPAINIQVGARILRQLANGSTGPELPYASALYNAGHISCQSINQWNLFSEGDYPTRAVKYNNGAILYLRVNDVNWLGYALGGVAVAGGALGLWWFTHRELERFI